jgi:hypothetical protein
MKISVGLYLDAWVARWESPTLTTSVDLLQLPRKCVLEEPAPTSPATEPEITSTRLPDAQVGEGYEATLQSADGRVGTWSLAGSSLPSGLSLDAASGLISGTPTDGIGDNALLIDFKDEAGSVATSTVRLRVQPSAGLGGGDVQVTLRWTGPADLDLHVIDPANDEIYYGNSMSASGGSLDRDANAACNGPADDDNAVENVFWPAGAAPVGDYAALVAVYADCAGPLDWELTIRRNGVVILDQTGTGASPTYTFSLGSTQPAATSAARNPMKARKV